MPMNKAKSSKILMSNNYSYLEHHVLLKSHKCTVNKIHIRAVHMPWEHSSYYVYTFYFNLSYFYHKYTMIYYKWTMILYVSGV